MPPPHGQEGLLASFARGLVGVLAAEIAREGGRTQHLQNTAPETRGGHHDVDLQQQRQRQQPRTVVAAAAAAVDVVLDAGDVLAGGVAVLAVAGVAPAEHVVAPRKVRQRPRSCRSHAQVRHAAPAVASHDQDHWVDMVWSTALRSVQRHRRFYRGS